MVTTDIFWTWSCSILLKTVDEGRHTGGKAYGHWFDHKCCIASIPWLFGSDIQAMYFGSWFDRQDVIKCSSGVPLTFHILLKNSVRTFDIELSLGFFDWESASIFRELFRYSVIIVMPNFLCQIYQFLVSCYPPFLINVIELLNWLSGSELSSFSLFSKRLVKVTSLPLIQRYLYVAFFLSFPIPHWSGPLDRLSLFPPPFLWGICFDSFRSLKLNE